jgi:hypothetical protein
MAWVTSLAMPPKILLLQEHHLTRPQLLERLKEESQVEDSGKGERVGARSLTRSTRR